MIKYKILNTIPECELTAVFVFEEKKLDKNSADLDKKFGGLLSEMLAAKDFKSKKMQMSFSRTTDKKMPAVVLVGLGKEEDLTVRVWKQTVGAIVVLAQNKKMNKLSAVVPPQVLKKIGMKKFGTETVIATEVANYVFDEYRSEKDSKTELVKEVCLVTDVSAADKTKMQKGVDEGVAIGEGVNYTRRLGNTPPSVMTPTLLGQEAQKMSKENPQIKVKVLSRPEMKKLNMGCLLGVSSGSEKEPKFIILEYKGDGEKQKPIVLVGKGITFDSGGLGIKPGNFMNDMKFDMLGAATVLGTIKAAAALGLKKNLVGLIPSCENMPSGSSYRPDDILTAHNGKTVEIIHTDAEGRLILADALSYAVKYQPKEVIDFATLTGACLVALGNDRSGLFSNDEKIIEKLKNSSETVGEQLWHLPLGEEYSEAMKSEVADIKNLGGAGAPGFGGASTAAAFLQFFTDYPWAHIDLSCSYYDSKGRSWIRGGANGFGVQTMIEYLKG